MTTVIVNTYYLAKGKYGGARPHYKRLLLDNDEVPKAKCSGSSGWGTDPAVSKVVAYLKVMHPGEEIVLQSIVEMTK